MKNRNALRVAARLWAGLGLLVCAALYFVVAPQVDSAEGALLGQGTVLSQGAIMRSVAVIEIVAGLWVLVRPRSYPGLTASLVAVVALWLAPRTDAPALLDLGIVAIDARFLIHAIEIGVVVAGIIVLAFSMQRVVAEKRELVAGRRRDAAEKRSESAKRSAPRS